MPAEMDPSASYSPTVGLLYVFNLIVGTGALALPKAFQSAGYVLSIGVLMISGLVSYISATFVIESLSVANAITAKDRRRSNASENTEYGDVAVSQSGPSSFEIVRRIEVSEMASMFLSRWGLILSYLSLNIYLFGDLAIYSTTVPKSFMNVVCAAVNTSIEPKPTDPCRESWPAVLDRYRVYQMSVIAFILVCLPMVLIGITKTKYIQLATTVSRWTAFTLMIVLASSQLISHGPQASPPAFNIHGFGSLFGVTVYAFMCHHSIPALVTPMSSKTRLFFHLGMVYSLVWAFYVTLSMTGAFAYAHVMDVYTLNFLHDHFTTVFYSVVDLFLALFPVFTLTTNYPIVAITLINNVKVLKEMILPTPPENEHASLLENDGTENEEDEDERRPRSRSIRSSKPINWVIPALVLGLPTIISLLTDNVLLLASITGSYPGVGVQFLIPCMLVMNARSAAKSRLNFPVPKRHASPFQSNAWIAAIFVWAILAIVMVTLNMIGVRF